LQDGPHLQPGPQRQSAPHLLAWVVWPHLQSAQVQGLHLHWSVMFKLHFLGLSEPDS